MKKKPLPVFWIVRDDDGARSVFLQAANDEGAAVTVQLLESLRHTYAFNKDDFSCES